MVYRERRDRRNYATEEGEWGWGSRTVVGSILKVNTDWERYVSIRERQREKERLT